MEKTKKIFIIFVLTLFMFTGSVFAENTDSKEPENQCSVTDLNKLRAMAANVKVTYVPVKVKEKTEKTDRANPDDPEFTYENYLDIKIYNMNTKLFLRANGPGLEKDQLFTSRNIGSDGAITIRTVPSNEVNTYTFEIKSDLYGCIAKDLKTAKITLPRYNFYSQLWACDDIQDFYLCQEYTTFKVDGTTFYDKVEEYKAKLLDIKEEEKEDNSTSSVVLNSVSKHKYLIVGLIVAVGVLLTVFILKRKKGDL